MTRCLCICILLLACWTTEARCPGIARYPFGSACPPSQANKDGALREPRCVPLAYAPIGSSFRRDFHENLPWANRLKADRIVPLRTQTTEAAPE
jgi:hypothetical protein